MKYRIGMVQRVIEETTVEVEASNREEAERKALELAGDGHVSWDFLEAPETPDIITVDVLP